MAAKMTTLKVRDMLAAYTNGEPVQVICDRFEVSFSTLNAHRHRHGLARRRPRRDPLSPEQLAQRAERARLRRLVEVDPIDLTVYVLPVYAVRLVSRPQIVGEES